MPIKLPDFQDTRCLAVGTCGALETDEKEFLKTIAAMKDNIFVASYRIGKSPAYVRIVLGGTSPKFVQIDVYKREAFGKVLPKVTHKRKDIEMILDKFMGKRISTSAFGRFILPVAELPEGGLIRSTFFGTKQGDLSITVSRAEFTIKGAPIRGLTWQFAEKGASIRIDLDARVATKISQDYMIEQLRLLDSGFRLFVLGESSDGTDQG